MRITKQLSSDIAAKLLEKKQSEISELQKKLIEVTTNYVKESIPKKVLDFFSKNKEWIKSATGFRLKCNNKPLEYDYFKVSESLPSNNGYDWVSLSEDNYNEILKLSEKISNKKTELRRSQSQVEDAIFNLRTFKRVEIEFPEAFKLLPKNGSTSVSININKVRDLIK